MRVRLLLAGVLCFLVAPVPGVSQSELVIAREGGKEYHRAGCDEIKDGKNVLALTRAQATARGLKPHDECDPANLPADKSTPRPRAPTMVYTDSSPYYHKKDCDKLGKDAQKVELEEAGKTYWPCPTCKPPIRKRKVPG